MGSPVAGFHSTTVALSAPMPTAASIRPSGLNAKVEHGRGGPTIRRAPASHRRTESERSIASSRPFGLKIIAVTWPCALIASPRGTPLAVSHSRTDIFVSATASSPPSGPNAIETGLMLDNADLTLMARPPPARHARRLRPYHPRHAGPHARRTPRTVARERSRDQPARSVAVMGLSLSEHRPGRRTVPAQRSSGVPGFAGPLCGVDLVKADERDVCAVVGT